MWLWFMPITANRRRGAWGMSTPGDPWTEWTGKNGDAANPATAMADRSSIARRAMCFTARSRWRSSLACSSGDLIISRMIQPAPAPPLGAVLGSADALDNSRLAGPGPTGRLPVSRELLVERPSGDLFGLTQAVGMGWDPAALGGPEYVIVSTAGGLRDQDGRPVALGYHTGHWEVGLLVREAAETLRA